AAAAPEPSSIHLIDSLGGRTLLLARRLRPETVSRPSTHCQQGQCPMRWNLSALLLATAIVASGFGVYRGFWDPTNPNHAILLGAFILLNCTAVVAAVFGNTRLRGACCGAALFGTAYLICVLHCGFGLDTIYD